MKKREKYQDDEIIAKERDDQPHIMDTWIETCMVGNGPYFQGKGCLFSHVFAP